MPVLGKWLTFLADSADHPGAALLADLTSLLAEHWATGQSPLEDASLAAQLAWIDPPPGMTGLQAALATEDPLRCPPAGPATDPGFDQAILEPLVRNYDRAAQAGNQAGVDRAAAEISGRPPRPAGTDMGCGLARDRAAARAARDRLRQAAAGPPTRTPSRGSAAISPTAACRSPAATMPPPPRPASTGSSAHRPPTTPNAPWRTRSSWPSCAPAGEAFAGEVVSAEPSRTIITAAGRPVLRPRFTVRTGDPVRLEPGRVLICPARPRQRVQITDLTRTGDRRRRRPRSRPGNGHARAGRRPARYPPSGSRSASRSTPGTLPSGSSRRRPDPMDARRAPRPAARRPRRGDAIMSGDRLYDPAAETDRVIAAVLADMAGPGQRGIIVDSPPGAGKTTLVVRAAAELAAGGESCIIVAQTNNQVDDLTARLAGQDPGLLLGRLSATRLHRSRQRCSRCPTSR